MRFVLIDDVNLVHGFFLFLFQFPGNSDPIYDIMLGTGEGGVGGGGAIQPE